MPRKKLAQKMPKIGIKASNILILALLVRMVNEVGGELPDAFDFNDLFILMMM